MSKKFGCLLDLATTVLMLFVLLYVMDALGGIL